MKQVTSTGSRERRIL